MPVQTFSPVSLRADLHPRLETQCLSAEPPIHCAPAHHSCESDHEGVRFVSIGG